MPNPKKPTNVKKAEGTFRHDRHNANEPDAKYDKNFFEDLTDLHLSSDAQFYYFNLIRTLQEFDILSNQDKYSLAILAEDLALWFEIQAEINKLDGLSSLDKTAKLYRMKNFTYDRVRKLLTEFGMTPVSRTRVHSAEKKPETKDEWDTLLKVVE